MRVSQQGDAVGGSGVLIFQGSTLAVRNFNIAMDESGGLSSTLTLQVAWEMWPLWLRVAIDHEAIARASRSALARATEADDEQARADLIEAETRAGMVTITAVAFALEAMARSAATHADLSAEIGSKAGAGRRVAETLKQCFAVPPAQFLRWRQAISEIFWFRNEAVHPDVDLRDPLPHPGVHALVPRPAHVFRLENAISAVDTALSTALLASSHPRQRLGKRFSERTSGWQRFAEDLTSHRKSLGEAD